MSISATEVTSLTRPRKLLATDAESLDRPPKLFGKRFSSTNKLFVWNRDAVSMVFFLATVDLLVERRYSQRTKVKKQSANTFEWWVNFSTVNQCSAGESSRIISSPCVKAYPTKAVAKKIFKNTTRRVTLLMLMMLLRDAHRPEIWFALYVWCY